MDLNYLRSQTAPQNADLNHLRSHGAPQNADLNTAGKKMVFTVLTPPENGAGEFSGRKGPTYLNFRVEIGRHSA